MRYLVIILLILSSCTNNVSDHHIHKNQQVHTNGFGPDGMYSPCKHYDYNTEEECRKMEKLYRETK